MTLLRAALLALPALLAPAVASAAEVALRADPAAPEAAVARALYGGFLAANPDAALETALVDLDGDRTGEIAVRFRHASTCDGNRCHTALLRHGPAGWKAAFERRAGRIETGAPSPGRGGANMADIVVDGGEVWRWDGRGAYRPLLESVGTLAVPGLPAPGPVREAALKALEGELAGPLAEARGMGEEIRLLAAEIAIGATGGKAWLVAADAPSLCGGVMGCPQVVLVPAGKGLRPALVTYGVGAVAVMRSASRGVRDLAFADVEGYRTMRWDGTAYRVAATSYPSPVTPAP